MKTRLSIREINVYAFYLLLVLLLSLGLISWLTFRHYNTKDEVVRNLVNRKIDQEKTFLRKQKEAIVVIDSAYKAIKLFNPAINAVYAENDIKNQLNTIDAYYADNGREVYYKVYSLTAALYGMLLEDKKTLQKKQSNVLMFKDQVQRCQIGFKESHNKMNLKVVTQQQQQQQQDDKSAPK